MKAAVLYDYGTPRYAEFSDPVPADGSVVVDMAASAISRLDINTAAGTTYVKPAVMPSVVGREGVGRLADGRRIYFDGTVPPYGTMAERALVPEKALIPVPDGVDDAVAAALGNSGLAGWLPLEWRAQLKPGEKVLILGATSIVGKIAVQAAKLLGAGRVVAAGRDEDTLQQTRDLGADATVNLAATTDLTAAYREAAQGDINVIIDYVWGPPAEAALKAIAVGARMVQVGAAKDVEVGLLASVARSKFLSLFGYATFHLSREVRADAFWRICELATQGKLVMEIERMPLAQIEQAWEMQQKGARRRIVVIP
jgi:NADPH:quinone reductase-like Zn-dependent oxidoreductase